MGSGGTQKHSTYVTAPTATAVLEPGADEAAVAGDVTALGQEHVHKVQAMLAQLNGELGAGPLTDDEVEDWYAAVSSAVEHASHHLVQGIAADVPKETLDDLHAQLKKASSGALASLSVEQLQQLAAAQGFQHSGLVGLNHQKGQPHALAHWLDPVYLKEIPSKQKIQAKALERYHALCTGESVPGVTLADADPLAEPGGSWSTDPAHFTELTDHFTAQVSAYHGLGLGDTDGRAEVLADLVTVSNKIHTAAVHGGDPDSVEKSKGAAHNQLTAIINFLPSGSTIPDKALDQAQADGLITAEQRTVLDRASALLLARKGVSEGLQELAVKMAEERHQQIADLQASHAVLKPFVGDGAELALPAQLQPGKAPETLAQVVAFTQAAQAYTEAEAEIASWIPTVPSGDWSAVTGVPVDDIGSTWLTSKFNTWAVGKNTGALKQVAAELGMENAAGANKALTKKYIASHWDPYLDKDTVQAHVTAKANSTGQTAAGPVASSTVTGKTAAPAVKAKKPTAKATTLDTTGFLGQHAKLVQALKQHGAAASAIPARVDPTIVAGHDFGAGVSAKSLGGAHSKSLHPGPDGGQWLFKPDNPGKGARAYGEAAASAIYEAAGIPAVPVYTATVGGKKGVVQPMVKGATPLTPNVKAWNQADVDAIVRTHVASWVMGDHDGHADNVLKTSAGGLIPIDAGQAFKYFGQDTLSMSYSPSTTPVHQKAYQAFLSGGLAKGVRIKPAAAHPVIKRIESIPDAQWRAMLHSTAHEGAKRQSGIYWVPTMRKNAAKQHGIPEAQVSTTQIAEAFLDHAVQRKKSLRDAFTRFFATELKLDGAAALKYGA